MSLSPGVRKLRTAMLADKLIQRGHTVVFWSSAFDHIKKKWLFPKDTSLSVNKQLEIIALKGAGYKNNKSILRFIDHRIIAWKFKRTAPMMKRPEIIVVSFPSYDLAYEATMFAKRNKIPVILDIRDEWPELFLFFVPKGVKTIFKLLLSYEFKIAKAAISAAGSLAASTSSLLEWGLNLAGRKASQDDKVFYLGSKNIFKDSGKKTDGIFRGLKNKFVVTFVGTFSYANDLTVVMDCAEKLTGSDIFFVFAGTGDLFKRLKKRASGLSNVLLTGWLAEEEIYSLLRNSHLGICPTTQIRSVIPNKVFLYLSAGLPILSSYEGELKEIINKYQIGFNYPLDNAEMLAGRIRSLYNDRALYKTMSENALQVFNKMFDADKIYEDYVRHVESVAAQPL